MINDFDEMMKAKKGIVKAVIISAEPLKKKNVETISSAIVGLAGVNKTVSSAVIYRIERSIPYCTVSCCITLCCLDCVVIVYLFTPSSVCLIINIFS